MIGGIAKMRADCAVKKRYLSETVARNAAYLFALDPEKKKLSAYKCRVCPHWHLTSSR